jgi:hypothetical protein
LLAVVLRAVVDRIVRAAETVAAIAGAVDVPEAAVVDAVAGAVDAEVAVVDATVADTAAMAVAADGTRVRHWIFTDQGSLLKR